MITAATMGDYVARMRGSMSRTASVIWKKTQTIEQYHTKQGVVEYDEKAHAWRQLIVKHQSDGPSIGKPTPVSNQLFFMASYDMNRFRAFIMRPSFNETTISPLKSWRC